MPPHSLAAAQAPRHRAEPHVRTLAVAALDPKELTERFSVGRAGSVESELKRPVAVAAHGDLLAVADAAEDTHRVSIFSLRGTFQRHIGEKPSKFSTGARPGQFLNPPKFIAMAEGPTLFVLEEGGSRVHVLNPETGGTLAAHNDLARPRGSFACNVTPRITPEPIAMLYPPFNLKGADGTEGALTGLCVSPEGLFVSSNAGSARILCLAKGAAPAVGSERPYAL